MNRFDILFDRPLPPEPKTQPENPSVSKPHMSAYAEPSTFVRNWDDPRAMIDRRDRGQEYYAQEWLGRPVEPPRMLRLITPSGQQIAIPQDRIHVHQDPRRVLRGYHDDHSYELHIDLPDNIAGSILSELPDIRDTRAIRESDRRRAYEDEMRRRDYQQQFGISRTEEEERRIRQRINPPPNFLHNNT